MKKTIVTMALLGIFFSAYGAMAVEQNKTTKTTVAGIKNEKIFTIDELAKYNGKNGTPAYIAIDGKVYDMTNAPKWKNGKHKRGAVAGKDMTLIFKGSSHKKTILDGLKIVGSLAK